LIHIGLANPFISLARHLSFRGYPFDGHTSNDARLEWISRQPRSWIAIIPVRPTPVLPKPGVRCYLGLCLINALASAHFRNPYHLCPLDKTSDPFVILLAQSIEVWNTPPFDANIEREESWQQCTYRRPEKDMCFMAQPSGSVHVSTGPMPPPMINPIPRSVDPYLLSI